VTLIATGSEVHVALAAREQLAGYGIRAAVISMPSMELFEQQSEARREVLLGSAPRIAIEAAAPFGWTRYVASEADVIGMRSFGASAPIADLYSRFGITADAVTARVLARHEIDQAA
jgi:transketolase